MGGPGMMGGFGPGGMGAMMGHGRALWSLDLDDTQRQQLRELQRQQRQQHWSLMGQMHEAMEALASEWSPESETRDRAAILAAYDRLAQLRRQLLEAQLDAADQVDKILTPEQRETLRSEWTGRFPGRGRR